jgi:hypothetical protein
MAQKNPTTSERLARIETLLEELVKRTGEDRGQHVMCRRDLDKRLNHHDERITVLEINDAKISGSGSIAWKILLGIVALLQIATMYKAFAG